MRSAYRNLRFPVRKRVLLRGSENKCKKGADAFASAPSVLLFPVVIYFTDIIAVFQMFQKKRHVLDILFAFQS